MNMLSFGAANHIGTDLCKVWLRVSLEGQLRFVERRLNSSEVGSCSRGRLQIQMGLLPLECRPRFPTQGNVNSLQASQNTERTLALSCSCFVREYNQV